MPPTMRDCIAFMLQYWQCCLIGSAICLGVLVLSAVRLQLSFKRYSPQWQSKQR